MVTHKRYVVSVLIIVLLWLASCLPENTSVTNSNILPPTQGETALAASLPSPIKFPATPKAIPMNQPTAIPTLTTYGEAHLFELLQSPNCELPCYLHIVPGITSWDEAKSILASLGASFYGESTDTDLPVYGYMLWVGDQKALAETPLAPDRLLGDAEIYHHVSLTVAEDKVQRINVAILTRKLSNRYREYWSKYSLREFFSRHGLPDDIYFSRFDEYNSSVGMVIVYNKSGIVVSFHGSRIGHVICPSFESHDYIERGFTLTNSTFTLNIFMPDQRLLTDGEYWLPIEEYLKISKREFYDQILSAPASCFVVKDMKP